MSNEHTWDEEARQKSRAARRAKRTEPNPKQKRFLRYVAMGHPAVEAYQRVYKHASLVSVRGYVYKLLRRPHIKEYLETLRTEIGRRNSVEEDEIVSNLRRARNEAFEAGNLTAAIRATEALAKFTLEKAAVRDTPQNPFQDLRTQSTIKKISRLRIVGKEE